MYPHYLPHSHMFDDCESNVEENHDGRKVLTLVRSPRTPSVKGVHWCWRDTPGFIANLSLFGANHQWCSTKFVLGYPFLGYPPCLTASCGINVCVAGRAVERGGPKNHSRDCRQSGLSLYSRKNTMLCCLW